MTSTPARLLIIGPQGSGKGTQGARIAEALGIPAVSTGDVFRANVKEGTELGLKVKAIIDAGDLVPDELTSEIVRDRLEQADAAAGFLLDGYPRPDIIAFFSGCAVQQRADSNTPLPGDDDDLNQVRRCFNAASVRHIRHPA